MAIDIEKLEDSSYLLDLLIQMEDVLDSLDIYVYENWLNGEIVSGPIVKRYWVAMSLLYSYYEMPNPKACLRLLKYGIDIKFQKVKKAIDWAKPGLNISKEFNKLDHEEENKDNVYWLITLSFPRRLLTDINDSELSTYEDEVEIDDVEDAKDTGMDAESQFQNDEQNPNDLFNNIDNEENLDVPQR